MTVNKTEIIKKEDIEVITEIAKKYNMSIENFAKLISKKKGEPVRHHVRFSPKELEILDARAKKMKVNRSKYCRLCYKKVLIEKLYKKMNIIEAVEDVTVRDVRVAVSFNDSEEYKEMRKLAEQFSVAFATLIRYFALTVEL